jgi:predicted phage terminase large subunit-like protein
MQRLSQHDPVGFIEGGNLGSDWHIVKIPAVLTDEFVSKLDKKYQDMIDSEMRAPDGRFSYWPYKEPIEQLLAMERGDGADQSGTKISRHVFNSQYQQTPIALGGNLIHGHHFKRYTVLPKIKYRKIYADTAMKTKEANDWSVFQCWGLGEDGKLYLLDSIRGKWEAPELQRRAFEFWLKNKVLILGQLRKMMVEDKASGTGLIQTLKLHPYNVQVEGIERDKDKLTRVMDALPYIESGLVCLPEDAPFTNDFLAECESFSADMTHDHDDQIDCLSDACIDMLSSANKINVWSALAEKRPEGKLNAVQKRFIPQIIVR